MEEIANNICTNCVKKYDNSRFKFCPICSIKLRPIIYSDDKNIIGGRRKGENFTAAGIHAGRCLGIVEWNAHSNGDKILVCRKCFLRIDI